MLSAAGAGAYVGASIDLQQIQTITTTTITTVLMTTSTIWSTATETVLGVLTTIQYTTSTSTVTFTGSDPNTVLLLHMDGTDGSQTFVDSSVAVHSVTARGNAQIDTTESKFGGASGLFDGSGDYLSIPDSADWVFGTGDFTVDFWVKRNSIGIRQLIVGQLASNGADGSASFIVEFRADNTVAVDFSISGTFQSFASTATIADTANWHHLALVRSGNTLYLYIDGTQAATRAVSTAMTDSSSSLSVGRAGDFNAYYFNGWIDELRISKGVARWTSNFTPPTSPY
jgi:hypothetical protein